MSFDGLEASSVPSQKSKVIKILWFFFFHRQWLKKFSVIDTFLKFQVFQLLWAELNSAFTSLLPWVEKLASTDVWGVHTSYVEGKREREEKDIRDRTREEYIQYKYRYNNRNFTSMQSKSFSWICESFNTNTLDQVVCLLIE